MLAAERNALTLSRKRNVVVRPAWNKAVPIDRINLNAGGRTPRILDRGDATGVPAFMPRSDPAPEGDGHVIALVHCAATNRGEVLILPAQDLAGEPPAVLKLPRRVPAGFHGSFVAA